MNTLLISILIFSGTKDFLKKELHRNFEYLKRNSEVKPYFILYRITEIELYYLEYGKAGLCEERKTVSRAPYVEVRVGDYREDGVSSNFFGSGFSTRYDFKNLAYPKFPLEDEEYAIRHTLWKMTDFGYKNAVSDYYKREKSKTAFLPEDTSASFSKEKPVNYKKREMKKVNYKRIKEIMDKFYSRVLKVEFLYSGKLSFYFIRKKRIIVNTEGTEIEDTGSYFLMRVSVSAFDKEGKRYSSSREFFGYEIDEILGKRCLQEAISFIEDFKKHVNGNEIKGYNGDVVLGGISSAKFISNLVKNTFFLSKDNYDNLKSFIQKIGRKITADIDVYDKPDIDYFNKKPLAGFLLYDDEGVRSEHVNLIERGILKNFLLKREPVSEFSNSNGHARSALYSKPFPFMTNVFVKDLPEKNLLRDSILIIEDIQIRSPLSFEITKGFILYKNGNKREIKNLEINFSSFEDMWGKIKGVLGNMSSFNFFEGNPYIPFSITTYDIILKDINVNPLVKKKIRND